MKEPTLKPRQYIAPNPGLSCPACHSVNSGFIGRERQWVCFDCLEYFTREQAYRPEPIKELRLIGYTEDGSHWYLKSDGNPVYHSKELMIECERQRVCKWPPEGYDPIWEYNWKKKGEELRALDYLATLTPDQIEELKKQLESSH